MSKNLKVLFVSCCLLIGANRAAAVNEDAPVIRLGGVSAYPGIALTAKHDSNVTQATDSGKISSNVAVLSPALVIETEQAANKYSFTYSADIGRYSNSSDDNYADHHYLGLAEFGLSSSSVLKVQPEFLIGHDDRGSTFASTIDAKPNEWRSTLLLGTYDYGAEEARGHLVVDLGYTDINYQNNLAVTAGYDRKLTSAGGTLYVRVLPKTSVLVNAKHTGISYKQPDSILSGNEQLLRAGVKWEATAQTSGEIKVGKLQKKFDSSSSTQYSGGSWQADVVWSPVPYINVDLVTSKEATETTLDGSSAILLSNTGANLSYELNDRITLRANGYQLKQDFVGATRSDSTNTFGLKAEYKIRKWLIGGAEYSNSAKTSNDAANDFKRNIFMLSVRTAL